MIRDAEIQHLKPGDVFYECESGLNIEARVVSSPVKGWSASLERNQWRFTAINVHTGAPIDYLLTEGFSHYGPRLYREPQYATIRSDGTMLFRFVGQK